MKLLNSGRQICRMNLLSYRIHRCSVGQVRWPWSEHSWGRAKPHPRFPSRLGNTSTQNMDNECFQAPFQDVLSWGSCTWHNWETSVGESGEKTSLQGSKHCMSLKNSSLCMGRDLRRCPGAPAVARGMNIWSRQLYEMLWKKFRSNFFSCLTWKEMHLSALCCPGRWLWEHLAQGNNIKDLHLCQL